MNKTVFTIEEAYEYDGFAKMEWIVSIHETEKGAKSKIKALKAERVSDIQKMVEVVEGKRKPDNAPWYISRIGDSLKTLKKEIYHTRRNKVWIGNSIYDLYAIVERVLEG